MSDDNTKGLGTNHSVPQPESDNSQPDNTNSNGV